MNIEIHELGKAELFVSIFQHFRQFTEHVNLMFKTDALFIQSMDSGKVIVFEVSIPATWFTEYSLSEDQTLGINTTLIYKVMNTRDKTQFVSLKSEIDNEVLSVQFSGEDKQIFDRFFEIPLLDLEMELLEIPEIDHQAEFSISSVNFAGLIHQMKQFGDNMQIDCTEDKIVLGSFSVDQGKMFAEISIDELNEFAIEEGENIKISFSLKYLHDICLYHKLTKFVEIKISADFPMVIIYRLVDDAIMKFYLAPKID